MYISNELPAPVDFFGNKFLVGDKVARPVRYHLHSAMMVHREVVKVEDGVVYTVAPSSSRVFALKHPDLLVINTSVR